jgi:hypothetical protein
MELMAMVGGVTVKIVDQAPVPVGLVRLIVPLVAPAGMVTLAEVAETDETAATRLPILAEVTPVKPLPVNVTTVPTGPEAGVPELMIGTVAPVTVKGDPDHDQSIPLLNAICPVVASSGTVTLALVSLMLVMAASCPAPTHATVKPVKPVPVMVMTVPTGPDRGETEAM